MDKGRIEEINELIKSLYAQLADAQARVEALEEAGEAFLESCTFDDFDSEVAERFRIVLGDRQQPTEAERQEEAEGE